MLWYGSFQKKTTQRTELKKTSDRVERIESLRRIYNFDADLSEKKTLLDSIQERQQNKRSSKQVEASDTGVGTAVTTAASAKRRSVSGKANAKTESPLPSAGSVDGSMGPWTGRIPVVQALPSERPNTRPTTDWETEADNLVEWSKELPVDTV